MFSVFFCFVFVVLASLIPETQGCCRNLRFTSAPNHGYRLNNLVIRTIHVSNVDFCEMQCYLEPNCISYNFKKKQEDNGQHKCDLNNATYDHKEHSGDFKHDLDFVYRGAENACAKKPCLNRGTCQAGFTNKDYQCLCISGFTGDHCESDIDECTAKTYPCDNNADCVNTRGSYECTCKDGFHGNGTKCTDIDECAKETHICDVNAVCNNTQGSYNCTCKDGLVGDGKYCTECQDTALGIESHAITDEQITASSEYDANHAAIQGRLNFIQTGDKQGAWSALTNDRNQWLQVDLIGQYIITRVATQGRNSNRYDQWVKKYRLQYGDDKTNFQYYREQGQIKDKVFVGNSDQDTAVCHEIKPPIIARYIRFRPVRYHNHTSMRVELYGCKQECQGPLGMASRAITDGQIRASSQLSDFHGRLHFQNSWKRGAWSARNNDKKQWLQIDLIRQYTVTGVATQGRNGANQWVTKYKLQYSNDAASFQYYKERLPGQNENKVKFKFYEQCMKSISPVKKNA